MTDTLLHRLDSISPPPKARGLLQRLDAIEAEGVSVVPDVDTSPLPQAPPRKLPRGNVLSPSGTEFERKTGTFGIVFDKPAQAGQFLSSLAFDDNNRLEAYKISLKETTGSDVPVRVGPDTGEIEYYDAETNRFAVANPPGASLSRIESLAGDAIAIIPELLAGTLAAIVVKHPVLVNAAASGGAFVGELARLSLGKRFGINRNVTPEQMILEAGKVAGISFVAGKVGDDVLRLGKFVLDALNGRVMNARLLNEAGVATTLDEAAEIADAINTKIGAQEFRFNLAQATNEEDLLVMQDFLKRSPEFKKLFRDFAEEQQAALVEFNRVINLPYHSRLPDQAAVGDAVQNVAKADVERQTLRQDITVQMKEAELDNLLVSTKTRPFEDLGVEIRLAGDQERVAFRNWADSAVDELDTIAGGKKFIPNVRTVEAASKLDKEAREALLPKQGAQKRGLIGERVSGKQEIPEGIRILRETIGGEKQAQFDEVLGKIFDPDAKFTFRELWDTVSFLKQIERVSAKGLSTETPAVGTISFLRGAMERDLRTGVQATPLGEAYSRFLVKYAREKTRLDQGTIGKMMERRGGRNGDFVVADEAVFKQVFRPGGFREAAQVHRLIADKPGAMQAMRETISDFYKREVVSEGRVNLAKHRKFMEQHERKLELFFTREEMALFRAGNVEKALQAREAARETVLKRINSSFEGEIANMNNPAAVLSMAWDSKNSGKMARLVKMLDRTPDVLRAVRSEARKEIAERTAGQFGPGGERILSAANLDTFLNGKAGERGFAPVVEKLFGVQYVKNLQLLNRALKTAAREPQFPNRSNTAFWIDTVKGLTRAYVGLFTRPGRFITALDRIRGRAANRAIVKAILNPGELAELMSLRGVDARTRKAVTLLGNLGGNALLTGSTLTAAGDDEERKPRKLPERSPRRQPFLR